MRKFEIIIKKRKMKREREREREREMILTTIASRIIKESKIVVIAKPKSA